MRSACIVRDVTFDAPLSAAHRFGPDALATRRNLATGLLRLHRGQTAGASEMLAQITGVETQARWTRCLYPWPVPLPVRGIP